MSEKRPLFELGDRDKQIEWIVRSCRVLAFYPEQYVEGPVDQPTERHDEFEGSVYRLDGESLTVIADYQDSSLNTLVGVDIAGEPEQDPDGSWFVNQKNYTKTDNEQARVFDLDIAVMQKKVYEDLDSALLPEYYERIEEEYEQQRRARREALEGLGPDEISSQEDRALQLTLEEMRVQDELGLSAVGDEELAILIEKLSRLLADPGTFVASLV